MGICASWVAVKDADFSAVLGALELEDTEFPDPGIFAPLSGATLPSGWVIVVANKHEWAPERLSRVSHLGITLGSFVEEHVMVSSLRALEDGVEKWSVLHDAEKGKDHLAVEGEPPAELYRIAEDLRRQQAKDSFEGVDYLFDVPVELGAAICGFRHDEDSSASFTALEPIYPEGWLKRLFFRY